VTETPRESETELSQKDVDRNAKLDRADVDSSKEANAPHREPEPERVGPTDSGHDSDHNDADRDD